MRWIVRFALAMLACSGSAGAVTPGERAPDVVGVAMSDGRPVKLSDFRGKVVMFVNVASQCGLTPQYEGLQGLYNKYKDKGLVVVGVPANNFNGQEPGSDKEIKEFCTTRYKVDFPMMSKVSVKGDDQHPLYKYLTAKETGGEFAGDVEWNFGKFLVDRNGNVMARFHPKTKPQDEKVVGAVEKALAAEPAEASKKEEKK